MKALTMAMVRRAEGGKSSYWGVYAGTVRTKPGGSVLSELELTEAPLLELPGGLGANVVNPAVKEALESYLKVWSGKLGLPCY